MTEIIYIKELIHIKKLINKRIKILNYLNYENS